jgi:hypothetical protein
MTRWERGAEEIEAFIAEGTLQQITGAAADGTPHLTRAEKTIATARGVANDDPSSAFILAYDAARQAAVGLLAQQGLRPTTAGGHYVVDEALRAQFGPGMKIFGNLRRRRNELEYPDMPDETASIEEAEQAVADAQRILNAAQQLLPQLQFFR